VAAVPPPRNTFARNPACLHERPQLFLNFFKEGLCAYAILGTLAGDSMRSEL